MAKPSSNGTNTLNMRSGVSSSSEAPRPAPSTDATIRPTKARLNGGNCVRSASAASMVAGISAVRLQTAASCGETPAAISAG